jgi:hypothetical protein
LGEVYYKTLGALTEKVHYHSIRHLGDATVPEQSDQNASVHQHADRNRLLYFLRAGLRPGNKNSDRLEGAQNKKCRRDLTPTTATL